MIYVYIMFEQDLHLACWAFSKIRMITTFQVSLVWSDAWLSGQAGLPGDF